MDSEDRRKGGVIELLGPGRCAGRVAALLVAIVVSGACGVTGCGDHDQAVPSSEPVQVEFDARTVGDFIEITYSVTNRTPAPILLFDRGVSSPPGYDDQHPFGRIDPGWAEIEILPGKWWSSTAVIRRALGSDDKYGCVNGEPLPFGRRLGPGERATDKLRLRLPLEEHVLYKPQKCDPATRTCFFIDKTIRSVELQVGWAAAFPPGTEASSATVKAFKNDDEMLWHFSHETFLWLARNHRLAAAPARPVNWKGRAYAPER
jgi:hypothetical protein